MPSPNRPFKGWIRSRAYREARRLLDEEYKRYLGHSQEQSRPAEDRLPPLPSSSPPAPPANQLKVIPPPPRIPPQLPPSPPLRSPSSAFSDALTERIFPDTPLQSSESSHPISPRRSPSPTNSTDSVEFLEEILPSLRSYFRILESDTFESLISQFPRVTTASIPQGAYTIGPHYFDPREIRNAITGRSPTSNIPVFLPNSTHPILVPVRFFNNLFPPSSVSILEIC